MKILLQAIKSLMRKTENSIKRVLNFFDEGGIIKQEHLPVPIISSPNGTRYTITVDDSGTLSATAITE